MMEISGFHIYMLTFFVGFIYAVASAVLSGVLGGDLHGDHHVDFGGGHEFDPSLQLEPGMVHFSPLSPTVLATFMTAFGGTGMICIKVFDMSGFSSAPIAIVVALGVSGFVFVAFEWIFRKTQASTNVYANRLVGHTADVITPIPEGGVGEIAFIARGLRQNAPARSVDGRPIKSASEVRIVRVVGNSYVVRPLSEMEAADEPPISSVNGVS